MSKWSEVSTEIKRLMPDVAHHMKPRMEKQFKLSLWHLNEALEINLSAVLTGIEEGWPPEAVGGFATQSARAVNDIKRELEGYILSGDKVVKKSVEWVC